MDNPYPWPLFSAYPPPKNYLPVEQICKMTTFGEDVGKYFFPFCHVVLVCFTDISLSVHLLSLPTLSFVCLL